MYTATTAKCNVHRPETCDVSTAAPNDRLSSFEIKRRTANTGTIGKNKRKEEGEGGEEEEEEEGRRIR